MQPVKLRKQLRQSPATRRKRSQDRLVLATDLAFQLMVNTLQPCLSLTAVYRPFSLTSAQCLAENDVRATG